MIPVCGRRGRDAKKVNQQLEFDWKGMKDLTHQLQDLNQMEQKEFTNAIGFTFEHSPWIAEQAWEHRPFSSICELHQTMINILKEAEKEKILTLIRAHPDLATRVKMTPESVAEQKGVGLDQLTEDERNEFLKLNQLYTNKFNFPFIMAVQGQDKEAIKRAMQQRLHEDYEVEYKKALQEVFKIAKFRLEDVIEI